MSQREIIRLHVIKSCVKGNCTVRTAAETLHLSERQIKQLKKEYRLKGTDASSRCYTLSMVWWE